MNNYIDRLGRIHTKPIKPNDDFPTNNAWIYTAFYKTLCSMNDEEIGDVQITDAISQCKVDEGLYSRHPLPYALSRNMTPVSHDEIIGIAMLSHKASVAITNRSNDGAYFCDIVGYEKKPKTNFFKQLIAWVAYLYRVIVKKESQRRITKDYPDLFGVFFTHRRQYRYIYESLSMHKRSLTNAICWASARLFDIATNNITPLHYLSTVRMYQKNNNSILFMFILKAMDRSIMRKYGDKPVEKLLEEYLLDGTGNVDKNHPWLVKIREYYNKGE
jgi:hypothetical protein